MTWAETENLLRECQGNPPAEAAEVANSRVAIPPDYADFLVRVNGLEGFVTEEQYLTLWRLEDISELNEAYAVDELLPSAVLIGTDGGDTGFGYDSARKQYIRTPLLGMGPTEAQQLGRSFDEFVKALAAG